MENIITHNTQQHRFETIVDSVSAYVEYIPEEGSIKIVHTIVPKAIGGRGIAAALVEATVNFAREQNLKIVPICSYAAVYAKRHPEYNDIFI